MLDLEPYRPVSRLPALTRDLSIVVANERDVDELGDRVRSALGDDAAVVEEVRIVSETHARDLPAQARARLAIDDAHKNVLVRVVLRPLVRTLTQDEGNAIRDRIYAAVHEGAVLEWANT
jgi:phenylalanyl-tRNA synthetase alpha chain